MSAAENPKLFFPEPKSAMRFFHQHMTKSLQNRKGGRKTFFFIIIMGQDSDKQNSTILVHRV
jgi:hypothetical protein